MKAAREKLSERLKGLTISTRKSTSEHQRRKAIKATTEAEVAKHYKLGGRVMESTNTGMDVVFATRLGDGVQVVIKTRRRSNSFKSAAEEREWRMTTEYQLNMPKVETLCEFYEVLETPHMYYVVMEKVSGQDLFEQMASGTLSHLDSREIVRQILDGLRVMHQSGRIHKDLKIENVMVDMESPKKKTLSPLRGEPTSPVVAKLIDFDTVQDWEPSSPKAKDVLGTDGYIAPEAYGGEYSPASDIYAVGVIMYKLLTGKFPSRPDLFDDQPGENWVGSAAMQRIQERLKRQQIDFAVGPLRSCKEAASLASMMLSYDPAQRPSAEDALRHEWFGLQAARLP